MEGEKGKYLKKNTDEEESLLDFNRSIVINTDC